MRIMRLLCAAACVTLTSCGPAEELDPEAAPPVSGPVPGTQAAAMCVPDPPTPKCINTKTSFITGFAVLSNEHHVAWNTHMQGAIGLCNGRQCSTPLMQAHGTKVHFKWNAWCVPNPNYLPNTTMVVNTDSGPQVIQIPPCIAHAERVPKSLRAIHHEFSGDTQHSDGLFNDASCIFVDGPAATPNRRRYCTAKGSGSIEVWPHPQFAPTSTNNNPYGSSLLLGVGYAAKHTDQPLTGGIDVGIIFGYGPAGFIFTPRVPPDADFSHHLGYVVDLKCAEKEAGKHTYYPVKLPARFANQDTGDEVLSEETRELPGQGGF